MKNIILSIILLLSIQIGFAQNQSKIDSLKTLLETNLTDKEKVDIWNGLAKSYSSSDTTNIFSYIQKAIQLSEEINYDKGLADGYYYKGWTYISNDSYEASENYLLKSLEISKNIDYLKGQGDNLNALGSLHFYQGNNEKALEYFLEATKINENNEDEIRLADNYNNIGIVYGSQNENEKL